MISYVWSKDIVKWVVGKTLYLSVVFSWQMKEANMIAQQHNGPVVLGGPAAVHNDPCDYDVLAMHNPLATFTTRGCLRACSFCIVSRTEGGFTELKAWKPNPIICDNNILNASQRHFEGVIDKVKCFPYIDFNQGLDARLFSRWHAGQLTRLRGVKVRFAFDHVNLEGQVYDALQTARAVGLKDFGVYVLIGYKDDQNDALYRLEKVREWGIRPTPMRYQPLDVEKKNSYCPPQWDAEELTHVVRYYSRLRWLEHIPFEQYKAEDRLQGTLFLREALDD